MNSREPIVVVDVPEFVLPLERVQEMVERKDSTILEELGGLNGLLSALETDREMGIEPSSIDRRRRQWGRNELQKKAPVRYLDFLVEAFGDRIVRILTVAAVISVLFGMLLKNPHTGRVERESGWIEGLAIFISVAVVTLTGSINNYQKALQFEKLENDQSVRFVSVIRGGVKHLIDSGEVVVGDLMILEGGIMLTCDGVFVSGMDLRANEAAMTGESDIIRKSADDDCYFLSGTLLEEGHGVMLVVAVGMSSYQGNLKKSLDEESGPTPLQEHVALLSDRIGIVGSIFALSLVAALCIKEGVYIAQDKKDFNIANFLSFLIVAIALVVVAIPEGLPLAVTITLAFSMTAMAKDNCLVRVLASCETMGCATAICSDKTGTLTTNVMTVVQGLIADEEFIIEGYGLQERDASVTKISRSKPLFRTAPAILDRFLFAMAINSSARQQLVDGTLTWVGNKTEHGLLGFVAFNGKSYEEMRAGVPAECKRQFPFNSTKKRMTTLLKGKDGSIQAYCKGASEVLLADCDRYLAPDGSIVELTPIKRDQFQAVIDDMAGQGNRTIGVAVGNCSFVEFPEEEPNLSLVFLGVMGIQDPIREAVPNAVLQCQTAGLIVRMVTGDNIHTAVAIAKKCNIYQENGWDLAMSGKELREMYDESHHNREVKAKLRELMPRLRVLARSSPSDKHILVGLLQDGGEVVGVTGDGTNDAPALKLADVGFAMNSGTDIAKGAADMILVDDNFASVVNAVRWGRSVNDNIRKFLQFQLAINCSGVLLTVVGSVASETSKEPFSPVQLLWLNLIMNTLAALALATETPEPNCLKRHPNAKQDPLISSRMRTFIACHGTFQVTLLLLVIFLGHNWFDTVDDPKRCNKYFPDMRYNSTYITNISGVNVTQNRSVWSLDEEYCHNLCTYSGGIFHNQNGRCQQGKVHSTMIFNTFIFCQIFNIFNARKIYNERNPLEGIWTRSNVFIRVLLLILCFQTIAVCLFGEFMHVTLLSPGKFFTCVGLGAIELFIGFIPRLLPHTNHSDAGRRGRNTPNIPRPLDGPSAAA